VSDAKDSTIPPVMVATGLGRASEELGRYPVSKRLMEPIVNAKPEVVAQADPRFSTVLMGVQIYFHILHCPP